MKFPPLASPGDFLFLTTADQRASLYNSINSPRQVVAVGIRTSLRRRSTSKFDSPIMEQTSRAKARTLYKPDELKP